MSSPKQYKLSYVTSTEYRLLASGVITSAFALTYFYLADNYFFSTRHMSKIFRYLLMTDDALTAWLAFAICVVAACWKRSIQIVKLVDFLSNHITWVAVTSTGLLALGSVFVYHNTAFSMDEYAEIFQARIFAAGQLSAVLPASVVAWLIPPGFNGVFLIASHTTGQAIGGYWPGFSLILALFFALHIPWFCNPCLTGIASLLIYRITLDITDDRRAAGWSMLFALASGTFLAYGISFYSMQARMTANLLFAWLLLKPSPYRSFAAGLTGSFALVIHSPLPHIVFAVPWLIAMAWRQEQRRNLFYLILGYLPLLIVAVVGWLPLRAEIAGSHSLLDPIGPSLVSALRFPSSGMLDMRVAAAVKMWLWSVPCLFIIALLGCIRGGGDYRVRLLFLSALTTFVGYIFVVFDQGHGWGYRYFQSAWGVIPVLAGSALTGVHQTNGRLAAFAGTATMLSLFVLVPFQMKQIERVIARHSAQLPKPQRPGGNVYFIRESGGFYEADLVQIDPLLRDPDLILFSRGSALDAALREQNWPDAVLIAHTPSVEQWSIGSRHFGLDAKHSKIERSNISYQDREGQATSEP